MTHRPVLRAATYLHDIGYAEPLRQSGFHPLDGARFLQEQGWPALVVGLVAHHSGARFVADVRGLSAELLEFDDQRFLSGPLADAVTYADQITGPERRAVDVETRMTEMLRQHGPDSPNARCHSVRTPSGPAPPLVRVPVSYTTFPGERIAAPRSWVEQNYATVTCYNRGGHFAAWEEPDLVATELRAAFRPLRGPREPERAVTAARNRRRRAAPISPRGRRSPCASLRASGLRTDRGPATRTGRTAQR